MKLSELWLREWVNLEINSKDLFDQLVMAGFEINEVKLVNFNIPNIVVGKIIKCIPYQNNYELKLVEVDVGDFSFLRIISDSPNCREGIKVPVAKKGNILFNNFKIDKYNKFGVISEGLLCSYEKLSISSNLNLIELPAKSVIGDNFEKYFKLQDNIFEIHSQHNRGDCLSILGISREIAASNNIKINTMQTSLIKNEDKTIFPIFVEDQKFCPRFLGRLIKNINIQSPIPSWMENRLSNIGILVGNTIINIINYVLIECGQPIQVYDFDYLKDFIIIRMAKIGEKITIFNNKKVKLDSNTLVIADKKKVLGIAGIISSTSASLNNKTVNIFLESAYFNPSAIVGKSNFYCIHTESSRRFEQGVDPCIQYKAMIRVTDLIIKICGGRCGEIIDVTNKHFLPKLKKIKLYKKKVYRLIGFKISVKKISSILKLLGFQVRFNNYYWDVIIPSWRIDIKIEEDLIEELVRVYGYNNIPKKSMNFNIIENYNFKKKNLISRTKDLLVDRGYNEIITYSFVNPKIQDFLFPEKKSINLISPISIDMSVMRVSLITGLLKTIIYNQKRQQNHFQLFELGFIFFFKKKNIFQELMLSGAISGNRYIESWIDEKRDFDFYDLKGDVESILKLSGKLNLVRFKSCSFSFLHPFQSAKIYLFDKYIGFIGLIHPRVKNKLNFENNIFVFELKWSYISDKIESNVQFVSHFPISKRDISILVPKEIPAADILDQLKRINLDYLVDFVLFDVYTGDKIQKDYKSLSISLYIQNISSVLVEKEIIKVIEECILQLKKKFHILLRE